VGSLGVSTQGLIRLASADGVVEAVVSKRGASLRLLRVGGVDLVEPTTSFAIPPGMAGVVLAPWPNRTEGASWQLGGVQQLLEVTERELGHANHGLFADRDFALTNGSANSAVMSASLAHVPGYPFSIRLSVSYTLAAAGITVKLAATNTGEGSAPVAVGAHPYLRLGAVPSEQLRIVVPAHSARQPDGRLLPGPAFPVAGTSWDLRSPRLVSDIPRHGTWESAPSEEHCVVLLSPEGSAVELWSDDCFRYIQLYLADGFSTDEGTRTALAVEPMTAPPNALRSGEGLRWLEPGEAFSASWGIRLRQDKSRRR
jgi:aldose 1-epimerase